MRAEAIKAADIRTSFLDFFKKNDHRIVPSSPVIPFDDPTILFTNAGMNQFKDVFTGKRKVDYKRAASSQKCIRAGGKHNDLDNVGRTARHHTFFEMLGNFSFGDYFKEEAIAYAWEWVTKDLGLDKSRLYASVYEEDDDAFELWGKIAPELKNGRILRFDKKDNFWSMGDVGPCGPCSEVHYDRGEKYGTGPEAVVNGEADRFVEIWNLVFMQFDQLPDGKVVDLPKPSVDTGAGLERLACVLQDKETNYGIDLFQTIIHAVSDLTRSSYREHPISHQVIADHIRALSFAIADGAGISNEGQGYVLRRILRRASRHGRLLGMEEPFIHRLVPVLVDEMGEAFPELKEKQQHIENVIRLEEESFGRTLVTGLELFDKVARKVKTAGGRTVPGEEVFRLYDTYGFPYDLTEIIAAEHELTLDRPGFEEAMERQREQSRAGADFSADGEGKLHDIIDNLVEHGLQDHPATEFERGLMEMEATVTGFDASNYPEIAVVLDHTPFYAEAGGQIGDIGTINNDQIEIDIESIHKHQDYLIHLGKVTKGSLAQVQSLDKVTASVALERRRDIMRNHTATHLTHAALRKVLGDHIKQSGSYVGPDRLRFDFSHHQPLTPQETSDIERIVNAEIIKGTPVNTRVTDIDTARKEGAMALFGEKYSDKVRVVSVGGFSKELCGGTHVDNVAVIGPYFIVAETGIASGIRRLEAITGREAQQYMLNARDFRRQVAEIVGRPEPEALDGVEQLRRTASDLTKEVKRVKAEMFSGAGKSVGAEEHLGDLILACNDFAESDRDTMAGWVDTQKGRHEPVVAIAVGLTDGKRTFMASASSSAVKDHGVHVGKLAKSLLTEFGGRGGGKESFAQGGIPNDADSDQLFEKAKVLMNKGG
ncbi:alanine--tRNA ligase [candidate division GN15 bacterium]|nr:alanine--tRNA ligase [candidate division GN15 bacterium]